MDKKSKLILGLKNGSDFTETERHEIVLDYLSSGLKKRDIWKKYTGQREEHGQLLNWVRYFGYDNYRTRRPNLVVNNDVMSKKKFPVALVGDSFEILQLKKRILELENQLKDAEMKAIAFSTMVDIAEKEFNIPIRKKVNTKPLKK